MCCRRVVRLRRNQNKSTSYDIIQMCIVKLVCNQRKVHIKRRKEDVCCVYRRSNTVRRIRLTVFCCKSQNIAAHTHSLTRVITAKRHVYEIF